MVPGGHEFWVGGRGYSSIQDSGCKVRARKAGRKITWKQDGERD